MNLLDISIIIFVIMESANVLILFFFQDFKYGNSMNVFDNWHEAKQEESRSLFAKYMVYWVAGTKIIFIILLLVILFTGSELTKIRGVLALILSISTFFWKLNPTMKRLDELDKLTPKGYSKTLKYIIIFMIILFLASLITHLAMNYI